MSGDSFPYDDLERHLATLDRRSSDYQFDLERDLPWARIDEPGVYFPPDYVSDLGFDAGALLAVPDAWELFQWAAALLTCEVFVVAEKQIIDFFEMHGRLLRQRSNQLLKDEEHKHIELFRRLGDKLREARPEWTFDFDRICYEFDSAPRAMNLLEAMDDPAFQHAAFWKSVVHFEENTIYMHKRLTSAVNVQPFWKAAHHAHAREEVQHVLTDMAHVEALQPDEVVARTTSEWLERAILTDFDFSYGVRVAERMVADAFPSLPFNAGRSIASSAVYHDIMERDPVFRRTRRVLGERTSR